MADKVYPKHIYEPIRSEIAISYIQHEFRKLFRKIPGEYWTKIDKDISDWIKSPELTTPRDFWNGVHGIAMGFKLKIGLIQLITAENIVWKKEKTPLDKFMFGTTNLETNEMGTKRPTANEMKQFFSLKENQKIKQKYMKLNQKLSAGTAPRDQHPIIAVETSRENKIGFSVHDGTRRLTKAILEDKKTLPAYVGKYNTSKRVPRNYWLPTSFLMDLVWEGERTGDYKTISLLLRKLIKLSDSGKYELKERVLIGENEFRKKLRKSLGFK